MAGELDVPRPDYSGRSRYQTWGKFPGGEALLAALLAFGLTLVATAGTPRPAERAAAAGLLTMCWLAGAAARRTATGDRRRWVMGGYVVLVVIMFAVAAILVMQSCAALFAIGPQVFLVLPPRRARTFVMVLSVVPAVRFIAVPPTAISLAGYCLTAALTLMFSLGAGSWMRQIIDQNAERASLIDRLRSAQAELERLSEFRGRLAERERIARDIHDTLTQGFASILMLVQAAARTTSEGTHAHEQLMMAAQTARENLAEARVLVAELAPGSLAGPLEEALRRLAGRIGMDLGFPVRLSVTGTSRELPADCEVALLRAAQEALSNVRRHAQACSVQFSLEYACDTARLTVHDNGRGFTPSPQPSGFGLRGMQSRAQMCGGTLLVRTAPGQGTTIVFEVPARTPQPTSLDPVVSL
jgi:signal transduction histidine kinase